MKPWCTIVFSLLVLSARASVDVPAAAIQYIQQHADVFHSRPDDVKQLRISSASQGVRGNFYLYVQQQYQDLDIYNALATIAFSADRKLVYATGRLVDSLEERLVLPTERITPGLAIMKVLGSLKDIPEIVLTGSNKMKLSLGQDLTDSLGIRLVWWSASLGPNFELAFEIVVPKASDVRQYLVRAADGAILQDRSLFVTCGFEGDSHEEAPALPYKTQAWFGPENAMNVYNVYPLPVESPAHGTRAVVSNPADPIASPYGWHDTDGKAGAEFDDTEGNNARVQEDTDGDDLLGKTADGGENLVFDFLLNEQRAPIDNLDAVLTNLFFWVNLNHDLFYQYGFKETDGNFQQNNYGRSGKGNDPVFADAMDGSGLNNARFYSPEDGSAGRMEMFLWGTNEANLEISGPDQLAGSLTSVESDFSANNKLEDIGQVGGQLVLLKDAQGGTYLGCLGTDLSNGADFAGKIVLIERGTCFFVEKVLRAQELGAIAVIVFNNESNEPIVMGGSDSRITIPAVMISRYDGLNLVNALLAGDTIQANISKGAENKYLDSSLDNLIITHEYGHGVSIRLTGGAAATSCLENEEQMGEGWSDYFGLLFTTDWNVAQPQDKRGVGTWLSRENTDGRGIRPYPYSYDLSINPLNYSNINNLAVPHGVGTVWCSMLWDMTWEIIGTEGVSNDWYHGEGGNNIALQLVIEALKLQPCLPGFVDGRDAIIQADEQLYGGKHLYAIWKAFSRRGLGANALENSPFTVLDGVANYDMPENFKTKIELLNAQDSIRQVNVTWRTIAEFDNDHFILERKTGAGNYSEIAQIPGLLFDVQGRDLRVADPNIQTGNRYRYRLSSVDTRGLSSVLDYTDVYIIPVDGLVAYPNPVNNGRINIKIASDIQSPVEINLYGVDGKRYFHQEFADPEVLYTSYPVEVRGISSGTYFIQLIYADEVVSRKIQVIQ